jgi:hypothetical protein
VKIKESSNEIKEEECKKDNDFYAEQDSDNDSDFEVQYKMEEDEYEDLKDVKKPIFIKDLIMGLMSDKREKF